MTPIIRRDLSRFSCPVRAAALRCLPAVALALLSSSLPVVNAQLPGRLKPDFAPAVRLEGAAAKIAAQANGKLIVAGSFSRVGTFDSQSIARFNADGTLDTGFVPPKGLGDVAYVAVGTGGKIAVLEITGYDFEPLYKLSRLNADGSLDKGFSPSSFAGSSSTAELFPFVLAVESSGRVLIAGGFAPDPHSTAAEPALRRYNNDGSRDTRFSFPSELNEGNPYAGATQYSSILPLNNGQVLVGGTFRGSSHSLVRLNADGSWDQSFAADSRIPYVLATQPDGKVLFLEGSSGASFVGGLPRRLNRDGSNDASFIPPRFTTKPAFNSLAIEADGKVLIGGYTSSGSKNGYLAGKSGVVRLNSNGTIDTAFKAPRTLVDGSKFQVAVTAVGALKDGGALVAGQFQTFDGATRLSLGRLKADGSLDAASTNDLTNAATIYRVVAQANGQALVLANGRFVNGKAQSYLSSFDGTGSLRTSFPLPNQPERGSHRTFGPAVPDALLFEQTDGKILVGGYFGDPASGQIGLKRFKADGSLDDSFNNKDMLPYTEDFPITAVQQPDGRLLLAGYENTGSYPVMRLNTDGTVDSTFVAAGDPATGSGQYSSSIYALALQTDGKIIAGGYGTTTVGIDVVTPNPAVFRLNANGSLDSTFRGATLGARTKRDGYGVANALSVQPDGKIVVGGTFLTIGDVMSANLVRLNSNGSVDTSFKAYGQGANGAVNSIALEKDGKIVLGGYFTKVDGVARAGVARLSADGSVDKTFDPGAGTAGTGSVNSIAITADGSILVGGDFTRFNGKDCDGLALLAGDIPHS